VTIPSIRLSDRELASGILDLATRLIARHVFASKGVLAIENAFAPEFIVSLRNAFIVGHTEHLGDRETDRTSKVGDKRIMVPIEIVGAFNTPRLYASPLVLPLMQDVLGIECVLGNFGAVAALPGAEDQHIHRDHPFLFEEEAIDTAMPAFAVTAIVPLGDLDDYYGTTRVWPRSHRIWQEEQARQLPCEDPVAPIGSCMLMDYRLLHQGTANHSEQLRLILYLSYYRPWFKDYVNFRKVRELYVPTEEQANIPEAYRRWFR
jgi:ectoine hydroxylase-related dioxygenase (phytanoyl-CoA dioxygenase family)